MKINYASVIILLIFLLGFFVGLIFYSRISKYNDKNSECEEEHIISNTQKACCAKGKCKIKDI